MPHFAGHTHRNEHVGQGFVFLDRHELQLLLRVDPFLLDLFQLDGQRRVLVSVRMDLLFVIVLLVIQDFLQLAILFVQFAATDRRQRFLLDHLFDLRLELVDLFAKFSSLLLVLVFGRPVVVLEHLTLLLGILQSIVQRREFTFVLVPLAAQFLQRGLQFQIDEAFRLGAFFDLLSLLFDLGFELLILLLEPVAFGLHVDKFIGEAFVLVGLGFELDFRAQDMITHLRCIVLVIFHLLFQLLQSVVGLSLQRVVRSHVRA